MVVVFNILAIAVDFLNSSGIVRLFSGAIDPVTRASLALTGSQTRKRPVELPAGGRTLVDQA